jgi:hypothetical protein
MAGGPIVRIEQVATGEKVTFLVTAESGLKITGEYGSYAEGMTALSALARLVWGSIADSIGERTRPDAQTAAVATGPSVSANVPAYWDTPYRSNHVVRSTLEGCRATR